MARQGSDVSEFLAGLRRLDEAVGRGTLELGIVVNQRYAKYQHERRDLAHPQGGKSHYLVDPLYERAGSMLGALAREAITPEGSNLTGEARDQVEKWVHRSRIESPKWFGDLANSHAPYVTDGAETVYERRPKARRLTDDELTLKNRWKVHPSRRKRGR